MSDIRAELDWLAEEFEKVVDRAGSQFNCCSEDYASDAEDVERAKLIIDRVKRLLPDPAAS